MILVTFPDRATERQALAFLLGRFSGRVLKDGSHLIPEAALESLARENISFTVKGKASYGQQVAAIRGCCSRSSLTTAAFHLLSVFVGDVWSFRQAT
jgi:hypothetical protein